jgi:hypothetical protein
LAKQITAPKVRKTSWTVANEVLNSVVDLSLECKDVIHTVWNIIPACRAHRIAISYHHIFIWYLLISSFDVEQ